MSKQTQTPGAMLKSLVDNYNLSIDALAQEIHISGALLYLIIHNKSRISVQVAFRLARYFKTTPEYWLSAQMEFDIAKAEKDNELQEVLKKIVKTGKGA